MHYAYRFQLKPTAEQRETLDYYRDTCRQLYNHALREFNKIPESAGTLNHRVRQVRDQLTDLKDWWDELNDLYSTVAQAAVMRIEDSITALGELIPNLPHSLVECPRRVWDLLKFVECVVVKLPTGVTVVIQSLTLFGRGIESEPVGVVHWE